jgi:hypothetical protein
MQSAPRAQRWILCIALAGVIATSACSSDDPPSSNGGDVAEFVSLFGGYSADYDPAKTPKELADWSDLVVLGRIDRVTDGRVHGEGVAASPTVVVVVSVSEVKKAALPPGSDGKVYAEMESAFRRRGDAYDRVAPRDVDVLLFLTRAPAATTPGNPPIQNPDGGRPKGQPLWRITTPQGFLMGTDAHGVYQVRDLHNYPQASIEQFFPSEERFPPDPDRVPEDGKAP